MFLNNFFFSEMGLYRTIVGVLGKMFAEGAFTIVFLYTIELYPTVMRSVACPVYSVYFAHLQLS